MERAAKLSKILSASPRLAREARVTASACYALEKIPCRMAPAIAEATGFRQEARRVPASVEAGLGGKETTSRPLAA